MNLTFKAILIRLILLERLLNNTSDGFKIPPAQRTGVYLGANEDSMLSSRVLQDSESRKIVFNNVSLLNYRGTFETLFIFQHVPDIIVSIELKSKEFNIRNVFKAFPILNIFSKLSIS